MLFKNFAICTPLIVSDAHGIRLINEYVCMHALAGEAKNAQKQLVSAS